MKRCVIVGGAPINNYEEISDSLREDDYFIFCDCGLSHREKLGIEPNLIIGDFDSYIKPETDIETIVLPCEKDDTDTVFAVKEALKRGFEEFLIIGAAGGRFDHTLGNISILTMLRRLNKKATLIDDFSEMEIISKEEVSISDSYPYFSLIAINGKAEGITIKNAKYPLESAAIEPDYQYGISNEVIKGKDARVFVESGELLLIKVRHE